MSKKIRIDKLFANLGYGSRREASLAARNGWISLRGVEILDASIDVLIDDVRSGALTLDDKPFDPVSPLTIMVHKPLGHICSKDENGSLIYDLLPERWSLRNPILSCAGRLDKDSTGMVILTDDGDLLHRIIHPRTHAEKFYDVVLDRPLQGNEADLFSTGEFLLQNDAKPLKPARWIPVTDTTGTMVLTEGRYHQIRRMFAAMGNHVVSLRRYKTGGLVLGDLAVGEYRLLSDEDIAALFSAQPVIS